MCDVLFITPNMNGDIRSEAMGTLLLARFGKEFTDEDLVLAEHSTTIVGMEMLRAKQDELEEEARKKAVVQLAIGTLSYSELEAVEHIFNELEGNEGLLVASKIADKVAGISVTARAQGDTPIINTIVR